MASKVPRQRAGGSKMETAKEKELPRTRSGNVQPEDWPEWSETDELKLFKLWHEEENLYNTKNKDFKKKLAKTTSMKRLCKELGRDKEDVRTHMATCRSSFSRAKKNRLDNGYRSLSYRQKYVLHKLQFLYNFVKPRKSGPRTSTGQKPRRKTPKKAVKPQTSDTESQQKESAVQDGSQQEDAKEPYDSTFDKDPITAEMEEEARSSTSNAANITEDVHTLDNDPITPEVERGQQVFARGAGDFDRDPITKEMEEEAAKQLVQSKKERATSESGDSSTEDGMDISSDDESHMSVAESTEPATRSHITDDEDDYKGQAFKDFAHPADSNPKTFDVESIHDNSSHSKRTTPDRDVRKKDTLCEYSDSNDSDKNSVSDGKAPPKGTTGDHKGVGETEGPVMPVPQCCREYHLQMMKMLFSGGNCEVNHNIMWGHLLGDKVNQMGTHIQPAFKHETDIEAFRAMRGDWRV